MSGVGESDRAGLRARHPAAARHLAKVLSRDRSVAVDGLFHLKNDICHQGMAVSDSTVDVLPILIRLLACRDCPVRREVFQLVRRVAQASTAWRRAARDVSSHHQESFREAVAWEVAVDRVLAESRPQFEALRHDPDAVISELAGELAASSGGMGTASGDR